MFELSPLYTRTRQTVAEDFCIAKWQRRTHRAITKKCDLIVELNLLLSVVYVA
jgi:hypothetical protein